MVQLFLLYYDGRISIALSFNLLVNGYGINIYLCMTNSLNLFWFYPRNQIIEMERERIGKNNRYVDLGILLGFYDMRHH